MCAFITRVSSYCRNVILTSALVLGTMPASRSGAAEVVKPTKPAPHAVKPEMELLITHPAVLDSPETQFPGPLSFGYLMEQLAGKDQGGRFTKDWLKLWLADQTVNGDVAPARAKMLELVLESWRKKDQAANDEDDNPFTWTPNLAHAPFKLIAVVNRMDLVATNVVATMKREAETAQQNLAFLNGNLLAMVPPPPSRDFTALNPLVPRDSLAGKSIVAQLEKDAPRSGTARKAKAADQSAFVASPVAFSPGIAAPPVFGYYGSEGGTGEGRFVFALTDAEGVPLEPGFTVIFEFTLGFPVPKAGEKTIASLGQDELTKLWAAKWHHLGTHEQFGPAYVQELIEVTTCFTASRMGSSASDPTIAPALAQLRTNDGVLDPVRELRQFGFVRADPQGGGIARLTPSLLNSTPAERFHDPKQSAGLAMVLNTQSDNLRKNLTITIPAAVQFTKEKEPVGLLAARALLPGDPKDFHWDVPRARDRAVVKELSLHSCNGCHGGDTACDDGCHLKAGPAGTKLSSFLATNKDGVPSREMKDRALVLKSLLEIDDASSKAALLRLLQQRHRKTH